MMTDRTKALEEALRRIADMKTHRVWQTVNEYHMRQTAIAALAASQTAPDCQQATLVTAQAGQVVPCGGCGCADPRERCLGCLHDFGTARPMPEAQAIRAIEVDILSGFLKQINDAASASPWVPPEYTMAEVISDLCTFLRQPRAQATQEPWGWWLRDLTSSPDKLGFLVRKAERLSIAQPPDEWEITPLYAAPPAITVGEAARVLLNSHTVQTMMAAGKPLDLAAALRSIWGDA